MKTLLLLSLVLLAPAASAAPCSFCDVQVELTGAASTAWVRIGYQVRTSAGVQNRVFNTDLSVVRGRASFFVRQLVPCNSATQEVNYIHVDWNRRATGKCAWATLPAPFETAPTTYRSCLKDEYRSCSFWRCKCKHGDRFRVTYRKGGETCRPAAGLRGDKCRPPPPPPSPPPIPCPLRAGRVPCLTPTGPVLLPAIP